MPDLVLHVGVPRQGKQQQQANARADLQEQAVVGAPGVFRGRDVTAPAVVDDAQFVGVDAGQGLVEDGV
ncbi:hypothetical protein D3C71_2236180 [compost metagenome]